MFFMYIDFIFRKLSENTEVIKISHTLFGYETIGYHHLCKKKHLSVCQIMTQNKCYKIHPIVNHDTLDIPHTQLSHTKT